MLLFDAHKLDISDEFKSVIDTIRQHNDDKIRCVLNKADSVTREQLVRVYGSLMWSSKCIIYYVPFYTTDAVWRHMTHTINIGQWARFLIRRKSFVSTQARTGMVP